MRLSIGTCNRAPETHSPSRHHRDDHMMDGETAPKRGLRVGLTDRFFDRKGRLISLTEWARKRQDPDFCRIGYWEGEGGLGSTPSGSAWT